MCNVLNELKEQLVTRFTDGLRPAILDQMGLASIFTVKALPASKRYQEATKETTRLWSSVLKACYRQSDEP